MYSRDNLAILACEQALEHCQALSSSTLEDELVLQLPCGEPTAPAAPEVFSYEGETLLSTYQISRSVVVQYSNGEIYAASGSDDFCMLSNTTKLIQVQISLRENCYSSKVIPQTYTVSTEIQHDSPKCIIDCILEACQLQGIEELSSNNFCCYETLLHENGQHGLYKIHMDVPEESQVTHETLQEANLIFTLDLDRVAAKTAYRGFYRLSQQAACLTTANTFFHVTNSNQSDKIDARIFTSHARNKLQFVPAYYFDSKNILPQISRMTTKAAMLFCNISAETSVQLLYASKLNLLLEAIEIEPLITLCNTIETELLLNFTETPEMLAQIRDKFRAPEVVSGSKLTHNL